MTRTLANYTVTRGPGDTLPADPADVLCDDCGIRVPDDVATDAIYEFRRTGDDQPALCNGCAPCSDCGGAHEAGTDLCPWEVSA